MKFLAITCLLAFSAHVNADGLGVGGLGVGPIYAPGHASVDYYAYPRYAFEYAVKDPHTGDNKAQWEKRDGDVVKGAYSLVEPDGSLRVVEYWADDKSGFNAVVKRVGPNVHPAGPVVAPIYKAPIPVLSSGAIAPISVGPIARYNGLAGAPLITGPLLNGGVSTASIIKHVAPVAQIPVAPIIRAPILSAPIYKAPIVVPTPILPAPIYKAPVGPILGAPLGGSIYPGSLGLNTVGLEGLGGLGGHGYLGGVGGLGGLGGWGGLGKGPIVLPGLVGDYGLVGKGLGPSLGPWDLGLGYKH